MTTLHGSNLSMGQLPPNPLLMNAEHQDAPPPSSTSPRRSRAQETPSQTQQVQRLVEFGLINDSGLSSNANARKKKKKSVGFEELDGAKQHRSSYTARQDSRRHSKERSVDHSPAKAQNRSSSFRHHGRQTSLAELKDRRSSMIAAKPRESRRERTFIGSQCAACEEPLEHILRGERILQLSCGHVAHEACFYEYIKEFDAQSCPNCEAPLGLDTRRGAGIDFENFNKLVRSVQTPDLTDHARDNQVTPTPWDPQPASQQLSPLREQQPYRMTRDHLLPDHTRATTSNNYHHGRQHEQHGRNQSGDTGVVSGSDYPDTPHSPVRRHDYDVQSLETSFSGPPKPMTRNPIPAPIVTVRSEFPTLSRSKHQQSLTCLITVEVVDGSWLPTRDVQQRNAPPLQTSVPKESYMSPVLQPKSPSVHPARRNRHAPHDSVHGDREALVAIKEELYSRCENWHGLDFSRFGDLILHGPIRVGKDRQAWQELECYLFMEMLICVKAKKQSPNSSQNWDATEQVKEKPKVSLKGSILIKKHLEQVETIPELEMLTLSLSVAELPQFHLQFQDRAQLEIWRKALLNLNNTQDPGLPPSETENDTSEFEEDDNGTQASKNVKRASSMQSSTYGASRSQVTAPTEYTNPRYGQDHGPIISPLHVPVDLVVVVPISSSMQGLKINLLRDALRFLIAGLGEQDRLGLVTFGSGAGGVPLVGMTTKSWAGWPKALEQVRPVGHKSMRSDVVEGANVAMDLLMQRKATNPLSSILLISDAPTGDQQSVDFVVSRAEAAKITIHSLGLGLTHRPDTLVELSTRTKASYIYVKDWMMLRESLGGCLGSLQSTSHQNVKLKLRLPEGSPAKFVKISGALSTTKRATGRDAEASLGDLRFGDKRDILVQLAIAADPGTPENVPTDPWSNIISGLEALGGSADSEGSRTVSVEEIPLIQADLTWGDILREGTQTQLSRPSLLAITMLPPSTKRNTHARPPSPPIPPHPQIVQRRMELLTSDMLSRSLTLVSRGQHDRANHLLTETRTILKGLGKGGLPPLPPPPATPLPPPPATPLPQTPKLPDSKSTPNLEPPGTPLPDPPLPARTPSPPRPPVDPLSRFTPAIGVDTATMLALDSELEAGLEWISHPAVFSRDTRKAVLQAIGVISSQRAYTFRSPAESLWASRISGIKRLAELNREWREAGDESLMEESA